MVRSDRYCLFILLVLLVSGVVLLAPAGLAETKDANDGDSEDRGLATLPGIGLLFERARFLSFEDRRGTVRDVARSMAGFLDGDVPKEKRCAAHFLSGEIREKGWAKYIQRRGRRCIHHGARGSRQG
jgi:hypothetical protein